MVLNTGAKLSGMFSTRIVTTSFWPSVIIDWMPVPIRL